MQYNIFQTYFKDNISELEDTIEEFTENVTQRDPDNMKALLRALKAMLKGFCVRLIGISGQRIMQEQYLKRQKLRILQK